MAAARAAAAAASPSTARGTFELGQYDVNAYAPSTRAARVHYGITSVVSVDLGVV